MSSRGAGWCTGALAAAVMLAGCGDAGPNPAPEGSTATSESTDAGPVTLPPEFLECDSERYDDDGTVLLAEIDLTNATWDVPAGFAEADGYVEENPPADQLLFWVAEPQPPRMPDAVGISIHGGLDWSDVADVCARIPAEAVAAWLADYHDGLDVTLLSEPEPVQIGGYTGITQLRQFADRISRAAWLFSQDHVLVIYCQWTSSAGRAIIEPGCADLRESIRVT